MKKALLAVLSACTGDNAPRGGDGTQIEPTPPSDVETIAAKPE